MQSRVTYARLEESYMICASMVRGLATTQNFIIFNFYFDYNSPGYILIE